MNREIITTEEAIELLKPVYPISDLIGDRRLAVFKTHLKAHSFIQLEKNDIIDVQTINAFMTVYDSVNEKNRHKLLNMKLNVVCSAVWRIITQ